MPQVLTTISPTVGTNVNSLIIDAAGILFGSSGRGGASNLGVIFELAKTGGSYSGAVADLYDFNAATGYYPSGLTADGAGNLLGDVEL